MNKTFIFDMDGVLIDTEHAWAKIEGNLFIELFGKKIAEKIGDIIGSTPYVTYGKAVSYGASIKYEDYIKKYDEKAEFVYSTAPITEGFGRLVDALILNEFKLGIVSSSKKSWIDHVLRRLTFSNKIHEIISLNDRSDLKPKPYPDGYLEAIRVLGGIPKDSIILEDSNRGIQAAKVAGAYVIGFKRNLIDGYHQKGADAYANTADEIIKLLNLGDNLVT